MYGKKGISSNTVEGVWTVWLNPRQARPGDDVDGSTVSGRTESPVGTSIRLNLGPSTEGGSLPTVISITDSDGRDPARFVISKDPAPIEEEGPQGKKSSAYHEGADSSGFGASEFPRTRLTKISRWPGKVALADVPQQGIFVCLRAGFEFGRSTGCR